MSMARTACHRLGVRAVHATDCMLAPYIARALSLRALDAAAALHRLCVSTAAKLATGAKEIKLASAPPSPIRRLC
jgi:hypothetical protein